MASLKDIPVIGEGLYDFRQALHGNPDATKAAYDQQIEATRQNQERMMEFLMGKKGETQAFYNPMQNMFNKMYGTQGINAPVTPTAPGGRINAMYQGSR